MITVYLKFLVNTMFNKYSFRLPTLSCYDYDAVVFRLVKGLSTKSSCLWNLLVGSVVEWIQNMN